MTSDLCDFLMSSVIKEKEREVDADLKAGRPTRQLKVVMHNSTNLHAKSAAKLPGDGSPPDWWEGEEEDPEITATRLQDDCEEPVDPPEDVGGWGPDIIYCCHTAQALVEDLELKKEHCDSDPPVDCWKSLQEVLPNYIAHYRKRRDYLCRTTTTTTITTTTTTITTTTPHPGEGDVRLMPAGGTAGVINGGQTAGRVEIRHNGKWGTVCEDNFGQAEAAVACRQMGLPGGARVEIDKFGQGKDEILLDDVECSGHEGRLAECHHSGWGVHNCGHEKDVAVECLAQGPAPAPVPDWCLELCKEHTEAEQHKCEKLCKEIAARTVHRDDCPGAEEYSTTPNAPAPSNSM